MIITIHLLVMYFIECYHFVNENVYSFFETKSPYSIEKETVIQIKNKCMESITSAYFLRIPNESDDKSCITIWKVIEDSPANKKTFMSGRSCGVCGNYGYKEEFVTRYPSRIICNCETKVL